MDKGENLATVTMKLEIANVVKRYSGTANQSNGFWFLEQALLGTLTPEFWISEFEKDFPNKGREIYDEMVRHYAKTNIQQHEENAFKEKAKEIRQEAREKIEELKKPPKPHCFICGAEVENPDYPCVECIHTHPKWREEKLKGESNAVQG